MFPKFVQLPYEVRREIWKHHVPRPRVVKANFQVGTGIIRPASAPPVLLHVCHESRSFLLSAEFGFAMRLATPTGPALICMNVDTDALQINYEAIVGNDIMLPDLRGIVHLELSGDRLLDVKSPSIIYCVQKFERLDTLSLIIPRSPEHEGLPADFNRAERFLVYWVTRHDKHAHDKVVRKMEVLAKNIAIDLKRAHKYSLWRGPLFTPVTIREDGSRYIKHGEFNPAWSIVVDCYNSEKDLAKTTNKVALENRRAESVATAAGASVTSNT